MRNRYMNSAALLLLASASVAGAQQPAAAPGIKAPAFEQRWDLGFRSTTTTGDEARYQRYQDLTTGLASKVWLGKETDASVFSFDAFNVGYKDQAYKFSFNQFGKLKITLDYTGQPLNYANNTRTPWKTTGGNVWTLDAATRAIVQGGTVPTGFVGIGNSAATDQPSVFRALATEFPMSAQRDNLNAGLSYRVNNYSTVDLKYSMTKRSGNQPWGASFAFNNANNIPMELDNTVNEFTAGYEMVKPEWGMVRAEYQGSFFKNEFDRLVWDNPLRSTDYTTGSTTYSIVAPTATSTAWVLNGPWDNSAYSNGRGPAKGLMSMSPSSQMNIVRLSGLYKMPNHTTLNGQFSFTKMTQDEALLPYTTNTTIMNAATFAAIPGLAALPRATADAGVQGINAMLNFATRPTDFFAFDMKYRFNDHNNVTPFYDYSYNVRFDGVPEYVPGEGTDQYDIRQNTIETGATLMLPRRFTALKVGYIMDDFKRGGRAFSDMTDYTLRTSLDAYQNRYFSLRGILEKTARIGSGLSLEHIEEGGGQNALRFYDEADLGRTKSSVILMLTPTSLFDVNLSLNTIDDEYTGEGHEFGLLSSKNTSLNASANVYLTDAVTFGGMVGLDKFSSNQAARNANPFNAAAAYNSWTDPNRNWYLDNDEDVISAGAWVDLINALPKTDIRLALNYSDSDNGLDLYGPRINQFLAPDNVALRTTGDTRACAAAFTSCFEPLPNVTNTWTQAKVDVKHMFRRNMGVGVGYQYEKFDIVDFATTDLAPTGVPSLATGVPRMDPLGAITTGYGNRPYTGSTVIVRAIYIF